MKTQKCLPYDVRYLPFCTTEIQKKVYRAYGQCGGVVNKAARMLSMDTGQVSKVIQCVQRKGRNSVGTLVEDENTRELVTQSVSVLFFDIETCPHETYVWDFTPNYIPHEMVIKYGHPISFAARWMGTDEVIYHECRNGNDKTLTKKMMALFDKADVVVGHNGKAFDVKTMKGRALVHGLTPPSPYKVVDTMLISKLEFKLPRNTLEFLAEHLGCKPKLKHKNFPGFPLWKECLNGNSKAWDELKEYNIGDIDTLEEVYYRLRSWATQHPNLGIYLHDTRSVCPKCASTDLERINPIATNTQIYPGYRCKSCGGLCRGTRTIAEKEKRLANRVNAA